MKSSQKAFDLIVTEEDGDSSYYTTHYTAWDFPGGASGPTIGVGFDCGYCTPGEVTTDWTGIVSAETVSHIIAACGLKGDAAHAFVRANGSDITITWEQAMQEFREREMPKWENNVEESLPNTDVLSGDSFGALVSLAYNRGASFRAPGSRDAEMRAIYSHMCARQFDKIPAEFLSMRRLWPEGGDLWRRRGHEADLFRAGLGQPPVSGNDPRPAIPIAPPPDRSTRALQARLNVVMHLSPPLDADGVFGPRTKEQVREFQKASGLTVDGIIGRATWVALDKAIPLP